MKKFGWILALGLLLVSCNNAQINGVIMYAPNKHLQMTPDFYAEIYVTKLNTDTLKLFLDVEKLKDEITENSNIISKSKNTLLIDSLKKCVERDVLQLQQLKIDSTNTDLYAKKAMGQLVRVKKDIKTLKTTANEFGKFGLDIPSGEYSIIFISEGCEKQNELESEGRIQIINAKINKNDSPYYEINFR